MNLREVIKMANKHFDFGLQSFDSLLGGDAPSVINVSLDKLHDFKNHPFKVLDDDKMQELVDSIKENGVLVPATVRENNRGEYELISGHRRKHACQLAGITEMPVIVKDLTDDEATIIMVDSNIQREELLPSEKAYAYKMKLEAIKRKGGRPKNDAQIEQDFKGKASVEIVAENSGESRANIQRYIRLTELDTELLEYVDNKEMALNVGVELSYLSKISQRMVSLTIDDLNIMPTLVQAKKIRSYFNEDKLTLDIIELILSEDKEADKPISVRLNGNVKKLFPTTYSKKDMSALVEKLVKEYFENGGD
jgi:ParB family chromosome partitioning protein